MTAAERVHRLALRAYPAEYRRERGAEILATLDEMGAGSSRPSPRQVAALITGGVRERGARATGGTRFGIWAEGCRLAALVLLLLAAASSVNPIAIDTWYSRLGFMWPNGGFTAAPAMGAGALTRSIIAVVLPLIGAAAICRGRSLIAIACPLLAAALFLSGHVGSGVQDAQYYQTGQEWLANAYKLGDAIFLAAPAALVWAGLRLRGGGPGASRSLLWLPVPLVLGALSIGYYMTSITFWPLGVLVVTWFVAARLSPHLAVAAFGVLIPVLAYVIPTAIGDADVYEYAIAVSVGAVVLAITSLASAIAFGGDAELDRPVV